MKDKTISYRTLGTIAFCIFLFFLGNRLSFLISLSDKNIIQAFIDASSDVIPSLFTNFGISKVQTDLYIGILFVSLPFLFKFTNWNKRQVSRYNEEYGSARMGKVKEINEFKDPNGYEQLFSENVSLSWNTHQTKLNNNTTIIGGSGSGKGQSYLKPNLLQCNGNAIVVDPKGSVINDVLPTLIKNNYNVKILDLIDFEGRGYNPFLYLKDTKDVKQFINTFIESTSDENKKGGDDFWQQAEALLYSACIYLILAYAEYEDTNFEMFLDLLDLADADEGQEVSKLDLLFEDIENEINEQLRHYSENPTQRRVVKSSYEFAALSSYLRFKKGGKGKTTQSILITIGARMDLIATPSLISFFKGGSEEIKLDEILYPAQLEDGSYEKTALFMVVSDSDPTFNFISTIINQQLFKMLYEKADKSEEKTLPVPTKFFLDEYANSPKIASILLKVATARSRGISIDFFLQSLAQLKSMHKNSDWETVIDNCDTILFLGGKGSSTNEYLSKMIGKETIALQSISESRGKDKSSSESYQVFGRELFAPDEIGRLPSNECLILFRGKHVIKDKKYNVYKHPNFLENGTYKGDLNDYISSLGGDS